tara:strand:+ start:1362 stop:2096 length:735 start_codon:yes stop_codon:yes gene_type:complete
MNYLRIIPSLLLQNKKLVKGSNFKNFKNAGSPKTTIQAFNSQKSDEIFLMDLDGYNGNNQDFKTLSHVSQVCNTPITYGGGLNNLEKIKLSFQNGADKVYLSSNIIRDTSLIERIANIYGNQSIVGGINLIADEKNCLVHNYKNIDPFEFAKKLETSGIGELKITFVNLEGSRKGMNIKLCEKFLKIMNIPIIFEGGIGSLEDIENCLKIGVKNIALGTILIFNDYNIFKIKQHLQNKNFNVRS